MYNGAMDDQDKTQVDPYIVAKEEKPRKTYTIEAAERQQRRRLLHSIASFQCSWKRKKNKWRDEEQEIQRRRAWAIAAIEREQDAMMRERFLDNMKNTQWFQSTISRFSKDYAFAECL